MNAQTETMLLRRIDALTKAVQHMAQVNGARLTKAQLANRLGCHRNTLRSRVADKGLKQHQQDADTLDLFGGAP